MRSPVRVTSAAAAAAVGAKPYTLGDGAASAGPAGGLTPAQLASAYTYSPTTGGTGQTVAIVDAYDDPNIESDLASFDSYYGLPGCTSENGCFKKVSQTGSTSSLPAADESGWSVEISLDVETVRAACRNCKILLVEANSPSFANLATAVDKAVSLGATEVSNSYGGPEAEIEQAAYNHPGVVITAATGDLGYDDFTYINEGEEPPQRPNVPAAFPSVVAVGGTTLKLEEDGTRASEKVWNGMGPGDDGEYIEGVSGGGCSTSFSAQLWQRDVPGFGASGCGTKRLDADVAADADPYTGLDIYDSYKCSEYCPENTVDGGWITVGGTSLSTPLIASLYGLAGGSDGVRYPALTLYGHVSDSSDLYDVTKGANGFCGGEGISECKQDFCIRFEVSPCASPNEVFGRVDCEGTTACNAAPGFDGPSGVGTPNGLGAFRPLLPTATITPPSSPKAGVAANFSAGSSSDPYPGGLIESYSWNWGDGTPGSTGVSPTHTFAVPGEYTVTLTVTDNYGLTSLASTESVQVASRTTKEIEEEAAAKKKAEEEAAAKKKGEEEAAAKKKGEEEAAAKKKGEEEAAAKKKGEEEAAAKKKAEEEVAVKKHQEEEVAAKKHQEEAAATKKREEEAAVAKRHEEEAAVLIGSQGAAGFQAHLPAAVPDAQLASTTLQVSSSGIVNVRVSCPARETTCSGTVTLRTLSAVSASESKVAKRPAILTLAAGSFAVPGGETKSVTLRLSLQARKLLARSHTLHARATVQAHDTAGATHTAQEIVLLRAARQRHG
jgi:PKD repeat protein